MGHTRQPVPQQTTRDPATPTQAPPDAQRLYGNSYLQQNLGRPPNAGPALTCGPGQEAAEQQERDRQAGRAQQVAADDQRLATLQRQSATSFGRDIHDPDHGQQGVHENGTDNRGPQVDAWNREAGVNVGSQWCGASVGHHYNQGTQGGFQDQGRLASDLRARNYFLYHREHEEPRPGETADARRAREGRNAQRDQEEATHRQQHAEQGSTRHYMTYRPGQADRGPAPNGGRPEVYGDAARMPVRSGDTVVFSNRWREGEARDTNHGHVAMVESGPDERGNVTIVEGNAGAGEGSNRVQRRTVNVRDPGIDGFGRPALGDMTQGAPPR